MDDCVILDLHPVVKDLLPDYVSVLSGKGTDDVEQFLDEDPLQLVIVTGQVPLAHEGSDVRVALPAFKVDLVPAEVKVAVGEDLAGILHCS